MLNCQTNKVTQNYVMSKDLNPPILFQGYMDSTYGDPLYEHFQGEIFVDLFICKCCLTIT